MLDFSGASGAAHPMLAVLGQVRAHIRQIDIVMSRGLPEPAEPVLAICAMFRDLLEHASRVTGQEMPQIRMVCGLVLEGEDYFSRHWICLPDGSLIDVCPAPHLPARLIPAEDADARYFEKKRVRLCIDSGLQAILTGEQALPLDGAPDRELMRGSYAALRRSVCDLASIAAGASAPSCA